MPDGRVVDRTLQLVAVLRIELGRLELVRHETDRAAAASPRLVFGGAEQP